MTSPHAGVSHPPLILSVFPGLDLLGQAFDRQGYCVVRGPDLVWGGDVRTFHVPPHHFHGVIGGSPCQDFSKLRRTPPTGEGLELLAHFARIVEECQPAWALLENVPTVPDVTLPGWSHQRIRHSRRRDADSRNAASATSSLSPPHPACFHTAASHTHTDRARRHSHRGQSPPSTHMARFLPPPRPRHPPASPRNV